MAHPIDADYLVVGAGAMGMAFTDAVTEHADVRVALVDRRHSASGHWLEAYPSSGCTRPPRSTASRRLCSAAGRRNSADPSRACRSAPRNRRSASTTPGCWSGRSPRARSSSIPTVSTWANVASSRTSPASGSRRRRGADRRARYLAPSIPAEKPPPFGVTDDARVVPVNDLARLEVAPSQYVVVGSGKTATDACIWLVSRGVDPDAICWVRPRDPWMMNRAVVQPDPAVFLGMAADTMQAAEGAGSLEDLFLRLEDAGIMLRIDRTVVPTMAKTPTLATWELEQLRTLQNVVRRRYLVTIGRGKLHFADGSVAVADDALVVHCAADGLKYPQLVPVWRPEAITLQPIRAGFPCFGARRRP